MEIENKKIIKNSMFWVEVVYSGTKKEGDFFLYPVYDSNFLTFNYFAFDDIRKKSFFEIVNKLPWIWHKTAYNISIIDYSKIQKAIDEFDVKFFESIPWIGPKTSKRVLMELKTNIEKQDIEKLNIDKKLLDDITKTLKEYWFESSKVKQSLKHCDIPLKKENLQDIIKRVIKNCDKF